MRPPYRPSSLFEPHYPVPFTPIARVRDASLTMLRTSLVTRDPEQAAEAIEDYEEGVRSVDFVLPQRQQWQHWKSDTVDLYGSANRPRHSEPLSRTVGLLEALVSGRAGAILGYPPGFVLPMQQAADERMGDFEPAPWDEPTLIMRDQPRHGRPVTLPGLEEDADVVELDQVPLRPEDPGRSGIDRAMAEVRLNQERLRSYLFTEVRRR